MNSTHVLILIVEIVGLLPAKTVSGLFAEVIGKESFPKHLMFNVHLQSFANGVNLDDFELERPHFQDHPFLEWLFFGYFNERSVLRSEVFDVKLVILFRDFGMTI